MTVEPERTPQRRENQAQLQSRQHPKSSAASPDDNSEMLRWRADQLLDEMMLGGVDVSAADLDDRPARGQSRGQSAEELHTTNGHTTSHSPAFSEQDADRPREGEPREGPSLDRYTENRNTERWEHSRSGTPPAPASPANTPSDTAPDLDIYFDAYESSYTTRRAPAKPPPEQSGNDPAHVESRSPSRQPADRWPDTWGETPANRNGQGDPARSDRPARTPAERAGSDARYEAGNDSGATDLSGDELSGGYSSRAGQTRSSETGYTRSSDIRERVDSAGRESTGQDATVPPILSKINGADYLSRRYGYVSDDGAPASHDEHERDFDGKFDSEIGRALGDDAPIGGTSANPSTQSRDYYERQRVDREERMRSAEHRPEPPLHGRAGEKTGKDAGVGAGEDMDEPATSLFQGYRARSYGNGEPRRDDQFPDDPARGEARSRSGSYTAGSYTGGEYGSGNYTARHTAGNTAREPMRDTTRDDSTYFDVGPGSARRLHEELTPEPLESPEAPQEDTEWIHRAKEKWNWQDVSGVSKKVEPEISDGAESLYEFELAGYDRDPSARREAGSGERGSAAGAMGTTNGKTRSTLLPRISSTSVDALQQRIDELAEQIAAILPVGHEYHERAHHLLDKAATILQNDPMRSAEVEYYMQQVRGIVQRQEHAISLSSQYRQRLQLYLSSWLAFSLVILLARYIFQFEFDAFLAGTFGLDYSGFLLQNAAAFTGSLFAGALGGSIGALLTLIRHARLPYGYVDRKYGLRGLILPIIGFLAGAIIYVPFALLYAMIGLDPSLNMIAASIAAVCAFAFGFNQESIYGTRE